MSNNSYRLTVHKGPQEGQSYSLVATMVTIGRDPMADIVITDPEVSRQHARLTRTDGGYEIQDLGSTNGTFLDGRRLGGEPQPLSPGQMIAMGSNISLIYEEVGDEMATILSPEDEIAFPEEETESEDAEAGVNVYDFPEPEGEEEYGTVLEATPEEAAEADVVETAPMQYEEVEEEFELPSFEEDEALPSFGEADDELPSFEEAAPPPYSRTVLEPEFVEGDYEEAGSEMEGELPGFDRAGEDLYTPEPEAVKPPPPPVPPGKAPSANNRNRNLIIAILALVFLCCCCAFALYIGYVYLGDILGCFFIEGYPNC